MMCTFNSNECEIMDYLESVWPGSYKDSNIHQKLTQKCIDCYADRCGTKAKKD